MMTTSSTFTRSCWKKSRTRCEMKMLDSLRRMSVHCRKKSLLNSSKDVKSTPSSSCWVPKVQMAPSFPHQLCRVFPCFAPSLVRLEMQKKQAIHLTCFSSTCIPVLIADLLYPGWMGETKSWIGSEAGGGTGRRQPVLLHETSLSNWGCGFIFGSISRQCGQTNRKPTYHLRDGLYSLIYTTHLWRFWAMAYSLI